MPKETLLRFSLPELALAMDAAKLSKEQVHDFALQLVIIAEKRTKRRGRPAENDQDMLLRMAVLLLTGQAENRHAAASAVTSDLPDSKGIAAKKRLYRKFSESPNYRFLWNGRLQA